MKILRALHLGMCFGVRDAIAMAYTHAQQQPLTVLGDLVHNETVLAQLRARGVRIAQDPADVLTPETMITAHGASEKRIAAARAQGLRVFEATCPLVRVAHKAVARLVSQGYHPVIVGKAGHVEVRGMTEDLQAFDVVLDEEDIQRLQRRERFGVVAQTTQPIQRVRALVDLLQLRFPDAEVRFVDTVCQPTKLRQRSAVELARQVDVVVVIGGAHSNNTRELVATCSEYCARVHHVQTDDDLRPEWFARCRSVGITAGTSTPDEVVDAVENKLRAWSSENLQEPSLARPEAEPGDAALALSAATSQRAA
jgi:4-hydroxy-3-methylbut-2-enyl diphosphate reductase